MTKRPHLEMDEAPGGRRARPRAGLRLEQALAATRRHYDGLPERGTLTEQRILEHAWPVASRRRPLLYLPLVALFVGSVAFAQELAALFQGARGRFFGVDERTEVLEPAPRANVRARPGDGAAPVPVPVPVPGSSESASPPERAAVRESPRVTSSVRTPESKPVAALASESASPRPAPASSNEPVPRAGVAVPAVDEFSLYREAHRAHFVGRDYASALAHWDRYLAAARHGSMVPEARYNRALALYHLGRRDEASAALRPFAEGAYGRYRRDEAQRLLESLGVRSSP